MKRIHSTALLLTGIFLTSLGVVVAPTAAFARIIQGPTDSGPVTAPVHTAPSTVAPVSSGMPGWELALIVVGAVFALVLVAAAVASRLRRTPHPVGA